MSVGEYTAKFESLVKYFRLFQSQPDEGWKCMKFENGLRYEIKKAVVPLEIRQFQVLMEKCRKIEALKKGRQNKSGAEGPSRP